MNIVRLAKNRYQISRQGKRKGFIMVCAAVKRVLESGRKDTAAACEKCPVNPAACPMRPQESENGR